jgi:hypothetical protein
MKVLGNRGVAVIITVVVVIFATLIGVYRSANRVTREVEAMFYDGVYLREQGFTQPGINSHLVNCANAALSLATLMEGYPELSGRVEDLLSARREFMAADSIMLKGSATWAMRDSFFHLLEAARGVDLSDRDKEAAAQLYATFNGALIAAFNSRYNDVVRERVSSQSAILRYLGYSVGAKQPTAYWNVAPFSTVDLTWSWD